MLVVRQVFHAKYGRGDELAGLFQEVNARPREADPASPHFRFMTDASGRFFTVVTEVEVEDFAAWETGFRGSMNQPWMGEWFSRMMLLVESGHREFHHNRRSHWKVAEMDAARFDRLSRTFGTPSGRRTVLAGLIALPLAIGPIALGATAKKRKKRRVRFNEYGCVSVGGFCKTNGQCCSSVCQGKKGKKRCQAHHTGTCPQGGPGACLAPLPVEAGCNGLSKCDCKRTTAGSDACVTDVPSGLEVFCRECTTDADCEAIGFPAGSVCVPLDKGLCAGQCESNRTCLPPCGADFPTP
jgi:hypothetical protein